MLPVASISQHRHRAYYILIGILLIAVVVLGGLFVGGRTLLRPNTSTLPVHPYSIVEERSGNWAGYVIHATEGSVTDVQGTFTVPRITCSSSPSETRMIALVGMDGVAGAEHTMMMGGVKFNCSSGSSSYRPFYQWGDTGFSVLSSQILPDDSIKVEVLWGQGGPVISVNDITEDWIFQRTNSTIANSVHRTSAEWITAHSVQNNSTALLANFDKIYFSNCAATLDEKSGPMGSFSLSQDTMVDSTGVVQAKPILPFWNDGTSFSVWWESQGP